MRREVLIGTAVAALVVLVLYALFAFRPLARKLQERRRVLAKQEQALNDARQLVSRYDEFQERAARIRMEAQRLERRLPAEAEVPDLLKSITRAATECNIREFKFTPLPREKRRDYTEQPIRITATCRYHSLGAFLTKLGFLPRLIVARDVKITGRDKTGKTDSITAEIILVTYVLTTP